MVRIYAYNKKGLQMLWDKVRSHCSTDEEALYDIYKTYGKKQWLEKCEELEFRVSKKGQ